MARVVIETSTTRIVMVSTGRYVFETTDSNDAMGKPVWQDLKSESLKDPRVTRTLRECAEALDRMTTPRPVLDPHGLDRS